MFEFFTGLVTGYLLTWPSLVLLVLLGIVFEHKGATGWAVFTGLVAAASAFFYFDVSLKEIGAWVAAYVIVGVLWSFWRYRVFVKSSVAELRARSWRNVDHFNEALERLHPSQHIKQITAWIAIWPFSSVENIVGDLISAIQSLVTTVFKSVYHKIYLSLVGPVYKQAPTEES